MISLSLVWNYCSIAPYIWLNSFLFSPVWFECSPWTNYAGLRARSNLHFWLFRFWYLGHRVLSAVCIQTMGIWKFKSCKCCRPFSSIIRNDNVCVHGLYMFVPAYSSFTHCYNWPLILFDGLCPGDSSTIKMASVTSHWRPLLQKMKNVALCLSPISKLYYFRIDMCWAEGPIYTKNCSYPQN